MPVLTRTYVNHASAGKGRFMNRVTIILETNPDAEDDVPIEEAVREALGGTISEHLGERIVSIEVTPTGAIGPDEYRDASDYADALATVTEKPAEWIDIDQERGT